MCAFPQISCLLPSSTVSSCFNGQTDPKNCGACNNVCPELSTCQSGACTCNGTLKNCNNTCVNTMSDATNCGACGMACSGATPYCASGACVATCPTGTMQCSNSCADTMTDPLNCGFCTNKCAGGTQCSGGVCGCGTGQSVCNGACTNFLTDAANCGACMHACPSGQSCSAGLCVSGAGGASGVGGSAGASAGGSAGSGTAGSGAAGGPPIPPERQGCAITPGLIADFEEMGTMPIAQKVEDRTGEWEMYNDKKGTNQTMTVESSGGTAMCDKQALHVKGSGYNDWGAGFGFSLVGPPTAPVVYNATQHQFTGITFKAKLGSTADSKAPVRFNVSTPWTEDKTNPGGQCVEAAATTNKAALPCYQHPGRFLYPGTGPSQLTQSFQTYTFCFDRDLYPLSLPSIMTPEQRANVATSMLKVQFQFGNGKDYSGSYPAEGKYPEFTKGLPFDFWIDDVKFITGDCPTMVTSPSNGSPAKPFPQNAKYGSCDIVTNAAAYNGALAEAYKTWTANFVRNNTVIAPEQQNVVTSESMGYGMMIAAAIGDKTTFDKFWGYVKGRLSGGLMTWKEGANGSASDGDIDIAYALYLANYQWGGYKTDADNMASAIAGNDLVSSVVRGGSMFKDANYNPSYFIPAAFRKFSALSGAVGANYNLVNANINANTKGVPTDWANPSTGAPSDAGPAQVTSDITDGNRGAMGYDSARVPWRLGQDVCLGSADGNAAVTAMVNYFAAKYDMGSRIDLMKAGWYKASDGPHTAAKDTQGSYIGPMGVAGMAAKNNAMRDSAFRAILDILESGDFNHTYFPSTIGFITALIMSGNFPAPQ